MQLHVIGSSSKGNCYILECVNEALILEAGCKLVEVKKMLNWNLSKVVGCAISHEHNDHAGYTAEYAKAGIKVLTLPSVLKAKGIDRNSITAQFGKGYKMGGFILQPFDVMHDVPCAGYIIRHQELGKLVFFTDTFACKYRFKNVTTYMIEANYCDDMLQANIEAGKVPLSLRNRIMTSHMELQNTIGYLRSSDLTKVNNIILVHLSAGNANAQQFEQAVVAATGIPTIAAKDNTTINISII